MSTNWKKIAKRLGLKNKEDLAVIVGATVPAFMRSTSGGRTLSPDREVKILEALAKEFIAEDEMLDWLNDISFFPPYLNEERKRKQIEVLFVLKELQLPAYYVHRNNLETKLVKALLGRGEHPEQEGVFITGIGGIGKTLLLKAALQQVIRNRDFIECYDDFYWLDCDGKEPDEIITLIASKSDVKLYENQTFLSDHIKEKLKQKAILVVLDGLHEPEDTRKIFALFNKEKSKFIVSSRSCPDKVFLLDLQLSHFLIRQNFSLGEIKKLYRSILGVPIGEQEIKAVRYLQGKTEGLPLAWTVLCKMMSVTGMSADEVKQQYGRQKISFLESGTSLSKYNSVFHSFQLSFISLKENHKTAARLFVFLGFFDINRIPFQFLENIYGNILSVTLNKDVEILIRLGLIEIERLNGKRIISLHNLLLQYAQEQAQIPENQWMYGRAYARAVADLLADMHEQIHSEEVDVQYALLVYQEVMHTIEFANAAHEYAPLISLAWLAVAGFTSLGLFNCEKRTLEILRKTPSDNTEVGAIHKLTLGTLHIWDGNCQAGEKALKKALVNIPLPQKGTGYLRLMDALLKQGKGDDAKKYLYEMVHFMETNRGQLISYEETKILAAVGQFLLNTGQLESALSLYNKILESPLSEKSRVEMNVEVANIYLHLGEFSEALNILDEIHPHAYLPALQFQTTYLLCKTHALAQNKEEAKIYYDEFIALAKDQTFPMTKNCLSEMEKLLEEKKK